jgi:hypothetical protein
MKTAYIVLQLEVIPGENINKTAEAIADTEQCSLVGVYSQAELNPGEFREYDSLVLTERQ